jgi:hypothetical protein
MHRFKIVLLSVVAVVALAGLASTASAVVLPEFTVETAATGASGTGVLETNAAIVGKVTCLKNTSETTATNKTSGAFHIHFTSCVCKKTAALGGGTAVAESLGDSAGIILSLGTFTLVRLKTADAGVFFLVTPFDIDCLYSTEELLNIKGSFLSLIEPVLTKTKTFKLNVEQSGGVQKIVEYENNSGTKVTAEGLKTEVANTGGFIKSAEESQANVLTTTEATEIVKTT